MRLDAIVMKRYFVLLFVLHLAYFFSCTSQEEPSPSTGEEVIEPVKDDAKPDLISYDFAMDSLKLKFDEPVELEFVKSKSDSYDLLIINDVSLVKYSSDSTSLKFRCIPCQLGGDYEFEYLVTDTAGNSSREQFQVKYYSGKLNFPVRVSDMFIDDKNGLGYVISLLPNKLTVFSLTSYNILDEIALDFLPSFYGDAGKLWRFTINPSNGLYYIYSSYSKSIFTYSIQSKALIKTFELPAENTTMPEYSSVYPMDIAFTDSGDGLVNTVNQWGNGGLLRIIHGLNNNTSEVIGPMDAGLMFSLRPNGDNSKVFLISEHSPFYYFDGHTNSLGEFSTPDPETNFTFFVPNRKNDLVYMSGHQAQFIINHVSGQRTQSSYLGLPVAGDFSYAEGEETKLAYLVDDSNLRLLNYEKRRTEFSLRIQDIVNVEGLVNTVDGHTMIIQLRDALYFIDLHKLRRRNL